MNHFLKIGVATALALGYASAHAGNVGTSSAPGDLLLFVEVVNSSNAVVGSYVGDTNIAVGGTTLAVPTGSLISAATDANLNTILTQAKAAGDTLYWGVQGAGGNAASSGTLLEAATTVTPGSLGKLQSNSSSNLLPMINAISPAFGAITSGSSAYSTAVIGGWDQLAGGALTNVENWKGNGALTAQTGLGSTTLYQVLGDTNANTYNVNGLGTLTLSAAGLSYSTSAVPLPPAIWLLGSGLLGLAGISRRKSVAA